MPPLASTRRAGAILRGDYDLLGYRGLQIGSSPDWHRDPVHGRRAPMVFWSSVPYLDAAAGDHKIIWELNRHQHWLAFGRAFALTRERRFYDAFTSQLASWLTANPPRMGINWASMLELAFRSLSWLWALEMLRGGRGSRGSRTVAGRSAPGARSPAHAHRTQSLVLLLASTRICREKDWRCMWQAWRFRSSKAAQDGPPQDGPCW